MAIANCKRISHDIGADVDFLRLGEDGDNRLYQVRVNERIDGEMIIARMGTSCKIIFHHDGNEETIVFPLVDPDKWMAESHNALHYMMQRFYPGCVIRWYHRELETPING